MHWDLSERLPRFHLTYAKLPSHYSPVTVCSVISQQTFRLPFLLHGPIK